jgi:hypothetical protein
MVCVNLAEPCEGSMMSFVTSSRQSLDGPYLAASRRGASPVLRVRALVRLRRNALDRRSAAGVDGTDHRELRARAWLITRPSARERLADELEWVLVEAEHSWGQRAGGVCLCLEEVEVARDEIARLAQRLRDPYRVRPAGVALVRRLLADTSGPLFVPSGNDELYRQVRCAAAALD